VGYRPRGGGTELIAGCALGNHWRCSVPDRSAWPAVMAAKVAGATTVVAVDVNETRLALAAELGATHTVNARTDDVADRLRQIRPGGLDYVLEITARPQMWPAVECSPHGVAVIGAAPAGPQRTIDMNSLLAGGRMLRGIVQGDSVPQIFIPKLVEL